MTTKGEYRVGINFNPSGDDLVGQIKRQAADLIDLIETIPTRVADQHGGEPASLSRHRVISLKALAQTNIEDAAKWGVKAATKGPMS